MCCEDENTHPKIPASGRNKKSLFMDLCFPVHFINFFVKKEKERERNVSKFSLSFIDLLRGVIC